MYETNLRHEPNTSAGHAGAYLSCHVLTSFCVCCTKTEPSTEALLKGFASALLCVCRCGFFSPFLLCQSGPRRLNDPRDEVRCDLNLIRRSALGQVALYNMLPDKVKASKQVKEFQRGLQVMMKQRLESGCLDWKDTFSPRVALWKHPLKAC